MPPTLGGAMTISILFQFTDVSGERRVVARSSRITLTFLFQLDYTNYWISDMLAPPLWSTISTAMSLGLTARQVIPLTFFGFLICGYVVGLNGRTAAIYRVPYAVILRSSFGVWGCIPAIIVRAFVAMMWTAITVVQGGGYLQNAITAIWPSYNRFPNHLPESANVTSGALLMIVIFWLVQTAISLLPMYKLRYFFLFKAVIVPPTWAALFLWAVVVSKGGGPLVTGQAQPTLGMAYSCLTALNVVIGLFSSLAVNFPDFGRFSKNEKSGRWQFLILPLVGTLGALAPIFVTSAYQQIWGEYQWFMPAVIASFESRAAQFFCGISFMIATIGNQVAAGAYPFSIDVTALAPKYINVFRATLGMAVFCLISNPWTIISDAGALLSFLSGYSCLMGPISGVMITNFYLVHKKKLDIRELYNGSPQGLYYYYHGWNWRAWLALGCGFLPVFPGFINSIQPTIVISEGAMHIYAFSWAYSITATMLVYYVLSVYAPDKRSFVEVAVYPAETKEEEETLAQQSKWNHSAGADSSGNDVLDEKEEKLEVQETVVPVLEV
ncbi:hypothetical protein CALVIDRAFT_603570 [Calocera viscosa TUFC12733]|uniref:NCS1 nucleoside transporter family n=1 Tax=Calocera viscosa (strain TUFC12733) TaxID=1330018 RepID=A0A167FJE4_CALVF|nr:hypothetical protein CALVIDRAFT_603570 [Calocera viscosa TUFC12733]